MEVAAVLRHAHISPQKVRLVADMIRRVGVAKAIDILEHSPQKAAGILKKLLNSAMSNAENNHGLDIDELWISEICVDAGPTSKRTRPRAKGRANRIIKRTSHVRIKVSDEEQK